MLSTFTLFRRFASLLLLTLILSSCSTSGTGSSEGDENDGDNTGDTTGTSTGGTTTGTTTYLTGTASNGIAYVGSVDLKDATGQTATATISNGSYLIDITNLNPPFILQASNGADPNLYSFANLETTANITQLTTTALYMANGNSDPATLFTNWTSQAQDFTTNLKAQQGIINANLEIANQQNANLLTDHLLATDLNQFTFQFAADTQGLNLLLSRVTLDWTATGITVNITGFNSFTLDIAINTDGFTPL